METMKDNDQLSNNGHEGEAPKQLPKKDEPVAVPLTEHQLNTIEIFRNKSCNISETCIASKICRPTFYSWYNKNPLFKEAIDNVDEEDLDFAESQLRFLMKGQYVLRHKKDTNGNPIPGEYELDAEGEPIREYITPIDNASVMFKLKTKGKKRGYVYRQEITGADGSAVGGFEINISPKKKKSGQ